MRKAMLLALAICLLWTGAGLGDWGGEATWARRRIPRRPRSAYIESNFKGRVRLRHGSYHRLPYRGSVYAWSSRVRACFRRADNGATSCVTLRFRPYSRSHFRCWFPSKGAVCQRARVSPIGGWISPPPASSVSMAQPKAYTRMIHAKVLRHLSFPGTWPKRKVMACVKNVRLGIILDARGRFLWKKVRFLGAASRPCLQRVLNSLLRVVPFPKPWPKGRKSARLTLQKLGLTQQTGK